MNPIHEARLERHQVAESSLADDDKKHNSNCLAAAAAVGKWPSQQLLQNSKQFSGGGGGRRRQEEELATFLKKRANGELLIQKTARLFETFLAPVQQCAVLQRTFLAFDQTVQLVACDMASAQPLTLSVVVNEPHINGCVGIDERCELSVAPASALLARNAFVIRRVQSHGGSEFLRFGQDFELECYASQGKPLCVYSSPKNPLLCDGGAGFKAHGEMKQAVGLALQRPNNRERLIDDSLLPNAFFCWRLLHADPELRFETIGENVPINAKVIVEHRSTRNNLCCESAVFSTIFGMECGVSCHTEKNIYGIERASNVWRISTKSSEF